MFASASGKNRRQPKSINWSYRKRGHIQRTQMNSTMNKSTFARKIRCARRRPATSSRRLVQAPEPRQRPAAEKQRHHHRRRENHVGVFAHEKQRELHRAVFDVVAAGQFLLGFRQIERRAVGFGKRRARKMMNETSGANTSQPCGLPAGSRSRRSDSNCRRSETPG
jgi:hypothetical protein